MNRHIFCKSIEVTPTIKLRKALCLYFLLPFQKKYIYTHIIYIRNIVVDKHYFGTKNRMRSMYMIII